MSNPASFWSMSESTTVKLAATLQLGISTVGFIFACANNLEPLTLACALMGTHAICKFAEGRFNPDVKMTKYQ